MRLSNQEINSIKKAFKEVFDDGRIFLFGSRVDDTKKGGDIDLYLIPKSKSYTLEQKIKFLVKLDEYIGEQKIDVVLSKDGDRYIEKEALKNGIEL